MISRMIFWSAQPAMMRAARFGPMPMISRRRSGSCSISSNTAAPKARTSFVGIDRADAADHARAEIFLDPLQRGGRARLEEGGPELQAMGTVVDPRAAHLYPLAGRDRGGVPDHGDQVALTAHLDPEDAETVLGIVERHPFHQPGKRLRWRSAACGGRRDGDGTGHRRARPDGIADARTVSRVPIGSCRTRSCDVANPASVMDNDASPS